jgi:hypothetical protein
MPRSASACRAVGNPRQGPSSVRWVTFAIIATAEDPTEVDQKVGLSRNLVDRSTDKRRSSIPILVS